MKNPTALTILLIAFTCLGCTTTKGPSSTWNMWSKKKAAPAVGNPARIVAIWSHDVLNTPGEMPTAGFGGRLYFYDDDNQASPVDGILTIHGYDDSQGPETLGKYPDKTFVFTQDQLKHHYGESELGGSYSIWIPWQAVGGDQLKVSLVPSFKTISGNLLVGHQTQNLLPGNRPAESGPSRQEVALSRLLDNDPRKQTEPAGYPGQVNQAVQADAKGPGFTTTTINVTRSMTQQMQNSKLVPGLIMPNARQAQYANPGPATAATVSPAVQPAAAYTPSPLPLKASAAATATQPSRSIRTPTTLRQRPVTPAGYPANYQFPPITSASTPLLR
ncbi:MAG: hypothetical protein OSB47_08220 [Pirellulaceae bacterium]|nr:hypothetical protein [Pirellulaceae bacterium]